MPLLTLQDAELAFGLHPLLDRASLTVDDGERIGLIGRNGTGKSSLLNVIADRAHLDDGDIKRRDGLRVVLVEQEPELPDGIVAAREPRAARAPHRPQSRLPRRARTLARRGAAGRVPAPVRTRRGDRPARGVRRRAEARGARAGARAGARPAAAGRADQPPRHRRHRAARGPDAPAADVDRDHARPLVPRPRGDPDRRARPRTVALVSGQFRRVRGAQGERARGRVRRQPEVRPVLEAGRGVDPQGRRGAAHARHGPRAPAGGAAARARAAARAPGQRQADARCRRALRQARRGTRARDQALRRPHGRAATSTCA